MNTEIITIEWEGPFSSASIQNLTNAQDYGVYQIYGYHNVFGFNSLLYVGLSELQTFGVRIKQHVWLDVQADELRIYVGRLGGTVKIDETEWGVEIRKAESLLIYYCTPPFNSASINVFGTDSEPLSIINQGTRIALPPVISNLSEISEYWNENWKVYKNK